MGVQEDGQQQCQPNADTNVKGRQRRETICHAPRTKGIGLQLLHRNLRNVQKQLAEEEVVAKQDWKDLGHPAMGRWVAIARKKRQEHRQQPSKQLDARVDGKRYAIESAVELFFHPSIDTLDVRGGTIKTNASRAKPLILHAQAQYKKRKV